MGDTINYEDLPEGIQGDANDYPFEVVSEGANAVVERGGMIYQKFTCNGCGNRLTMDVPNTFFKQGSCDQCGVVTDIEARGCNFLAVFPLTEKGKDALYDQTPSN
jgi:hypothetical protein